MKIENIEISLEHFFCSFFFLLSAIYKNVLHNFSVLCCRNLHLIAYHCNCNLTIKHQCLQIARIFVCVKMHGNHENDVVLFETFDANRFFFCCCFGKVKMIFCFQVDKYGHWRNVFKKWICIIQMSNNITVIKHILMTVLATTTFCHKLTEILPFLFLDEY